MFDDKEKKKFYAELLRNLGTTLIAGSFISVFANHDLISFTIICVNGIATILASILIIEKR